MKFKDKNRKKLEGVVDPFFKSQGQVKNILDLRADALQMYEKVKNPTELKSKKSLEELSQILSELYIIFTEYVNSNNKIGTLESISLWLGVSRERIRQIQVKGLKLLQSQTAMERWNEIRDSEYELKKGNLMMASLFS